MKITREFAMGLIGLDARIETKETDYDETRVKITLESISDEGLDVLGMLNVVEGRHE